MSAFDFVASKMYEFRAPPIIHFGQRYLKSRSETTLRKRAACW